MSIIEGRLGISSSLPSPLSVTTDSPRSDPVTDVALSIIQPTAQPAPPKIQATVEEPVFTGDFAEVVSREPLYLVVDGTGGMRQGWEVVEKSLSIAQKVTAPIIAVGAACAGLLAVTGILNGYIALKWWLPDAKKALETATKELESLKKDVNPGDKELIDAIVKMINDPSMNPEQRLEKIKGFLIKEARTVVDNAKLSVKAHKAYVLMSAGQTNLGTVSLLTTGGVLTGSAATTAAAASTIALGAIYVARGAIIHKRASKSYSLVTDFRNNLHGKENIKDAMQYMETAEKVDKCSKGFFSRRVNGECLKGEKEGIKGVGTYTSTGFITEQGILKEYDSDTERLDYIKRVDKGLYTEQLRHKIAKIIAISMIIGGVLAIAAGIIALTVFTGGGPLAIAIIGLISAAFFCSAEIVFLTYDSTRLFKWMVDQFYKSPQWITRLESEIEGAPVFAHLKWEDPDDNIPA